VSIGRELLGHEVPVDELVEEGVNVGVAHVLVVQVVWDIGGKSKKDIIDTK
jgi:hypothetical protein